MPIAPHIWNRQPENACRQSKIQFIFCLDREFDSQLVKIFLRYYSVIGKDFLKFYNPRLSIFALR